MGEQSIKRVLLLDDEKLLVEIYKTKLEQRGYNVWAYYSGYDALDALRGGLEPDVVIFDITMPESMSGYEFLETVVREGIAKRSIKIVLTNEGQDAEILRMRELGVDEYLLKSSLLPAEIVTIVGQLLEKKASLRWAL